MSRRWISRYLLVQEGDPTMNTLSCYGSSIFLSTIATPLAWVTAGTRARNQYPRLTTLGKGGPMLSES